MAPWGGDGNMSALFLKNINQFGKTFVKATFIRDDDVLIFNIIYIRPKT